MSAAVKGVAYADADGTSRSPSARTGRPALAATIRHVSTNAPRLRKRSRRVGSDAGNDAAGSQPTSTWSAP
jgi:hypothetical protein